MSGNVTIDTIRLIVGLAVLLSVIIVIRQRRKGIHISGPVLVLQKFKVDESAPDGLYMELEGRGKGLIAWLMTLMGLEPKTTMRVTSTELHKQELTLFGQIHTVIPLSQISVTHGGYAKSVVALVLFLLFGVGYVLDGFILLFGGKDTFQFGVILILSGIIIGAVCAYFYWFRRRLTIAVKPIGGDLVGVTFQRSIIENVPVDLEKTLEAVGLLHRKVIASQVNTVSP
jgi:hypothetical protein